MSNGFLLAYFEETKKAKELLLDFNNPLLSSYLNARQEYKESTFNKKPSDVSLSDLNEEFNSLVNTLKNDELEQFILNTSIQDIVLFGQLMIDEIKNLSEDKLGSVEKFINNKIAENRNLLVNIYKPLPDHVKNYIDEERYKYKNNLYLHSEVSVETFREINRTYDKLINSLDADVKICFVNALMYQDFVLICELFKKDFNLINE